MFSGLVHEFNFRASIKRRVDLVVFEVADKFGDFAGRPTALRDVLQGDGEAKIRQAASCRDFLSEEGIEGGDIVLGQAGLEVWTNGVQRLADASVEARRAEDAVLEVLFCQSY